MADKFDRVTQVCSATDASRGVYSKLQDDRRPLKERIELCSNVLHDPEVFLPNKNQILAEWLCEQLRTYDEGESRDDNGQNCTILWRLLREALQSRDGEQTTLRQHFLQIVLKEFNGIKTYFGTGDVTSDKMSVYANSVFTCVTDVLQTPRICPLLFTRLENISEILKASLECFLVIFHLGKTVKIESILNCTNAVLTQYTEVIQRQTSQQKVFDGFCKSLLRLLLVVRNGILKLDLSNQGIEDLKRQIDSVTATCLFHKDHLIKYRTPQTKVSEQPSPKRPKVSNYTDILFNVLQNPDEISTQCNFPPKHDFQKIWTETVPASLPFILEMFLDSLKNDMKFGRTPKFNFFVKLYGILDVVNVPSSLQVLEKMLQILSKYNVYQVAEDNITGQVIYKWFAELTKGIVVTKEIDSSLYECLRTILKLNHKLIEGHLEEILVLCFASGCKDTGGLLCDIIKTYTKLQQVEFLVKNILTMVTKVETICESLPAECLRELSFAFQQCPVSLTFNLFNVFLGEMKTLVDVLVSNQRATKVGTALEMAVAVFVIFLTNSSFNATDPHGIDATKTATLSQSLNRIQNEILQPLVDITPILESTSRNHVMFSTLYLLHGTKIALGYLNQHDILADTDVVLPDIAWNANLGIFSVIRPWDELEVCGDDNAQIRLCMVMFVIQRARQLLAGNEADPIDLKRCIDFLFSSTVLKVIPKVRNVSWNGDTSTVTPENFPVAFWHMLAAHATLLLPYCEDPQVDRFARCFIKTLSHPTKSIQDEPFSVVGISRDLLLNGDLFALSFVQEAIVARFWQLVGNAAEKMNTNSKLLDIFEWSIPDGLSESRSEEQTSVSDTTDIGIQKHAGAEMSIEDGETSDNAEIHKVVSLSRKLTKVMKTEGRKSKAKILTDEVRPNVEGLMKILNVFEQLPCIMFTPVIQSRCLLGLLACDVLLGKPCFEESLTLQLSCRKILCCLLDEWLVHREYRTWKIIDMEHFLAWLLSTVVLKETSSSPHNDTENHFNMTTKILRSSTILAVRSRKRENMSAITDFVTELVELLGDHVKPEDERPLRLLLAVVSACTELLQEKLLSKSALRMLPDLIATTMLALKNRFVSFFQECGSQETEGHILVLQLAAALTKGVSLGLKPGYPRSENVSKAIEEWSDLISTLYQQTREAMGNASAVCDGRAVVCNSIMEDLSHCVEEHLVNLPEEFEEEVFRLGLDSLWRSGLPCKDVLESGTNDRVGSSLRLLSAVVQTRDGIKCASLLESLSGIDGPPSKVLVGLSVMKYLLANKVVKKRKKDIRARFANILVLLLANADDNTETLVLVMEIIAAVLYLGNDAIFSQDLNIVFQVLAAVRGAETERVEMFQRLFAARFQILSLTLFHYKDYVYGVVHLFLNGASDLLSSLLSTQFMDDSVVLKSCAQKMSRLFQEMASHKEVLSKYATHFITTCIHLLSTKGTPALIRDILIGGVHCLLDICKEDTLTKIHVYLPNNERELFKSLKEDYKKHHKFKGNA